MTTTSIQSNATITASGTSLVFTSQKEVSLFYNSQGTLSGGTIQFTMQEVDPGDQMTPTGPLMSSPVFSSAPFVGFIQLPAVSSGCVLVSWNIASGASVTGLFLTAVDKQSIVENPAYLNSAVPSGVQSAMGSPNSSLANAMMQVGGRDPVNGILRAFTTTSLGHLGVAFTDGSGNLHPALCNSDGSAMIGGVTLDGANRVAKAVLTGGTQLQGNSQGNTVKTQAMDGHGRAIVTPVCSTYTHLNSVTSVVISTNPCVFQGVVINKVGGTSSSLTIFDNTTASGPEIASIPLNVAGPIALTYNVATTYGLSVTLSGASVGDVTILSSV